MDGMRVAVEPLRIVCEGDRYGFEANGVTDWLPPSMWPNAAALVRRMEAMNAVQESFQRMLDDAQAEADAQGGVQTAWQPYA